MCRVVRRIILAVVVVQVALVAILTLAKRRLPSRGDEDSDEIALAVIMDAEELISRARRFRGGSVVTAAGACQLDLRGAAVDPRGATLAVRTILGATSVTVPEGWYIEVVGRGFGGAIADRTKAGPPRSTEAAVGEGVTTPIGPGTASGPEHVGPRLRLEVLAILGAVEVGHEPAVGASRAGTVSPGQAVPL